ncbi:MAG TPA: hypothetical protein VH166_05895 [Mycobacterium sp.]|jgi:hypothetical protein|nr:hypothetical protein [Mycobacterium sp.]
MQSTLVDLYEAQLNSTTMNSALGFDTEITLLAGFIVGQLL